MRVRFAWMPPYRVRFRCLGSSRLLELEETALGIPGIVTKPKGVPASIEFEGLVSADQMLVVRRLDLLVSPIHLAGEGHLHFTDEWDFEARVAAKPVSLAKLPRGVSVGTVKSGRLDAMLVIRGQGAKRSSWESSGRVRLEKGLIAPEGSSAIRDVTLTALLDRRDITIQELALTMNGSDLRARGSVSIGLTPRRSALSSNLHNSTSPCCSRPVGRIKPRKLHGIRTSSGPGGPMAGRGDGICQGCLL